MSSLESKAKRFTSTEHSSAEYSYKSKVWFHKHGGAVTDVLFQTFIQQVTAHALTVLLLNMYIKKK